MQQDSLRKGPLEHLRPAAPPGHQVRSGRARQGVRLATRLEPSLGGGCPRPADPRLHQADLRRAPRCRTSGRGRLRTHARASAPRHALPGWRQPAIAPLSRAPPDAARPGRRRSSRVDASRSSVLSAQRRLEQQRSGDDLARCWRRSRHDHTRPCVPCPAGADSMALTYGAVQPSEPPPCHNGHCTPCSAVEEAGANPALTRNRDDGRKTAIEAGNSPIVRWRPRVAGSPRGKGRRRGRPPTHVGRPAAGGRVVPFDGCPTAATPQRGST